MQSKLMNQLCKQQPIKQKQQFQQSQLDDTYTNICKTQPKNLMLVQFLTLILESGIIKNLHKLTTIVLLYTQQRDKAKDIYKNTVQQQQQYKLNSNQFIKLLKSIVKKLYMGLQKAQEGLIYQKFTRFNQQNYLRMKIDQNITKYLNIDTIKALQTHESLFETIFEMYMPQNYNQKLGFSWREIKLLEKKIPIISFLKFLYEAQICPQYISATQLFDICNKMFPPNNSNHKQVIFYCSQTATAYMRQHISQNTIKLIQGDIGLNFIQFQMLMIRISTQYAKDIKQQYSLNMDKLMNFIQIKQVLKNIALRKQTKFTQSLNAHIVELTQKKNIKPQRKDSKNSKLKDLFDSNDSLFQDDCKKTYLELIAIKPQDIKNIIATLNDDLPALPDKVQVQQENQGIFDINLKHVVIGEQLPKLQQKNKQSDSKNQKNKQQDTLLGYKPQNHKKPQISCENLDSLLKPHKKIRINNQFSMILTEILYPHMISSLSLNQKCSLYLETCYINLGQKQYEQAFINFRKGKSLNDLKCFQNDVFYDLLEGQIYQSAGKDQAALKAYNSAKNLSLNLTNQDNYLKAACYLGFGSCLYHLCFLKAKQIRSQKLQIESIQHAILQNNIGCCLMMINRNNQAIKHFQISYRILDLKVGKFDERTLHVQQNINKNRKAYIETMPEFKTMWRTYVDKTETKKVTKGKIGNKK